MPEPFPWIPLVRSLAAHAVPGLESVQFDGASASVTRLLPASGGHSSERPTQQSPVLAEVRFGAPDSVTVRFAGGTPAEDEAALARLRSWLDLDAPGAAVDHFLSGFPLLAPLVEARPGLRIPGSVDPWETAVLTVLGQQVSLAAARTFGSRLVAEFGTRGPGGFWLFPSPQRLAGASADELQAAMRITGSRARTIQVLAEAVAGGLELAGSAAGTRAELLALPGIGPWTVDYLAVRAAGDRDAFVPGDLVLRRALGVGTPWEAAALAEPWRPWRAYALFHLWTAAAYDAPAARAASGRLANVRTP
ncbi:DNA-3-methyladenine glycosylase family protein [Arthrobacter gandavensis]|uniref:DNA-3-methyladenine glycosylase family protein n=1 Tax=Arthrobacter gandavensis TaxID=169960 RepID=UPI002B26A9ED|nr:AlkA N-terminal domain-containing protein [Arthrobacter gandavensis]